MKKINYLIEAVRLCDFIPSLLSLQRDEIGTLGLIFPIEWANRAIIRGATGQIKCLN